MPEDNILERSQKSPGFYLIARGTVHVFYKFRNRTIDLLIEGEYFGDLCILGSKSHVTYEATMNTICMFIPYELVQETLERNSLDYLNLKRKARLRLNLVKNQIEDYKELFNIVAESISNYSPDKAGSNKSPDFRFKLFGIDAIQEQDNEDDKEIANGKNKGMIFKEKLKGLEESEMKALFPESPEGSQGIPEELNENPLHLPPIYFSKNRSKRHLTMNDKDLGSKEVLENGDGGGSVKKNVKGSLIRPMRVLVGPNNDNMNSPDESIVANEPDEKSPLSVKKHRRDHESEAAQLINPFSEKKSNTSKFPEETLEKAQKFPLEGFDLDQVAHLFEGRNLF